MSFNELPELRGLILDLQMEAAGLEVGIELLCPAQMPDQCPIAQFAPMLARAKTALLWDAVMATGVVDMLWVVLWALIAKMP